MCISIDFCLLPSTQPCPARSPRASLCILDTPSETTHHPGADPRLRTAVGPRASNQAQGKERINSPQPAIDDEDPPGKGSPPPQGHGRFNVLTDGPHPSPARRTRPTSPPTAARIPRIQYYTYTHRGPASSPVTEHPPTCSVDPTAGRTDSERTRTRTRTSRAKPSSCRRWRSLA